MNAATIEYVWKAIQESERSNERQFMDDEILITAMAPGSSQPLPAQSGAAGGERNAEAAISLKGVNSPSLQTVTLPALPQP